MVKHNNVLPNQHFRKNWQLRVKTWFNQPAKKAGRRAVRKQKAQKVAPRPVDSLRPVIRCSTVRYNTKLRQGRGFTLKELKDAKVTLREAKQFGITVDHRRKNRSAEGLQKNVERLQEYKNRLIVIKKGDTATYDQVVVSKVMPIVNTVGEVEYGVVDDVQEAYKRLRKERSDARLVGKRAKRAKEKAEEEANKKK